LFKLSKDKPTVFVFGGGSGAEWMNQVMSEIAVDLDVHANVIHVTGNGKMRESLQNVGGHYNAVEFLTHEMADAYAAADLVVCRAGLATITELSALRKSAIMIPLPHSPQERNAKAVENAITVVHQGIKPELFLETVLQLLSDLPEQERQANAIDDCLRTDVADEIVDMLRSL
jgi:UDP-N-acetylglucosamine--N-acetylmuramyl-(pentapeptide) pyrophosphoryl-undecaprenol N-acetylglucosamine transferase